MSSALFLSKALRFFYGIVELLDQLFVTLVGRKVQPVEARVTARKPGLFANLFDAKQLRTIAPCALARME